MHSPSVTIHINKDRILLIISTHSTFNTTNSQLQVTIIKWTRYVSNSVLQIITAWHTVELRVYSFAEVEIMFLCVDARKEGGRLIYNTIKRLPHKLYDIITMDIFKKNISFKKISTYVLTILCEISGKKY